MMAAPTSMLAPLVLGVALMIAVVCLWVSQYRLRAALDRCAADEARLKAHGQLLAQLGALAHAAVAQQDLAGSLQQILAGMVRLCRADRGSLLLLAPDNRPRRRLVAGVPEVGADAAAQHIEQALIAWAGLTHRATLVADMRIDRRIALSDGPAGAALAVPIVADRQLYGLIVLTHHTPAHFGDDQLPWLQTVADQIALALRGAWLLARQRQLSEQREATGRAKSAFLTTMSHELRAPLNTIIGSSELLGAQLATHSRADLVPAMRRITAAGQQLLTLADEVLDFSAIEAGQMLINVTAVDAVALAIDVLAAGEDLASTRQTSLRLECPADIGLVCADGPRLRQVLLGLITNATHCSQGGTVTLRVHRDDRRTPPTVSQAHARGRAALVSDLPTVVFEVIDSGHGMPSEQVEWLFKEVGQDDRAHARCPGGPGIGLAMSRRLCRLMGGEIRVVSAPGQGSTFSVRLPAANDLSVAVGGDVAGP